MPIEDVLEAIRLRLGTPQPESEGPPDRLRRAGELLAAINLEERVSELSRMVERLEAEAGRVGVVPQGYPWILDLIMRLIHALLPWYTRPIREFSLQSAAVLRELASSAAIIRRDQERIVNVLRVLLAEARSRSAASAAR